MIIQNEVVSSTYADIVKELLSGDQTRFIDAVLVANTLIASSTANEAAYILKALAQAKEFTVSTPEGIRLSAELAKKAGSEVIPDLITIIKCRAGMKE